MKNITLFLVVLTVGFLAGSVQGFSCSIKDSCSGDEKCVITMSYPFTGGSHLAACNSPNAYSRKVCCTDLSSDCVVSKTNPGGGASKLFTVSDTENAHGGTEDYYDYGVWCTFISPTDPCEVKTTCTSEESCVIKLSDYDGNPDNAHAFECSGITTGESLCCDSVITPYTCSINPPTATLGKNQDLQMNVRCYNRGQIMTCPGDAVWSSSGVGSISSSGTSATFSSGGSVGSATVTVSGSVSGTPMKCTSSLNVLSSPPCTVTVSPSPVFRDTTAAATVSGSGKTKCSSSASWSINGPCSLTGSGNSRVVNPPPVSAGVCTIGANCVDGDDTAVCAIGTADFRELPSLTISPNPAYGIIDQPTTLTATCSDAGTTGGTCPPSLEWDKGSGDSCVISQGSSPLSQVEVTAPNETECTISASASYTLSGVKKFFGNSVVLSVGKIPTELVINKPLNYEQFLWDSSGILMSAKLTSPSEGNKTLSEKTINFTIDNLLSLLGGPENGSSATTDSDGVAEAVFEPNLNNYVLVRPANALRNMYRMTAKFAGDSRYGKDTTPPQFFFIYGFISVNILDPSPGDIVNIKDGKIQLEYDIDGSWNDDKYMVQYIIHDEDNPSAPPVYLHPPSDPEPYHPGSYGNNKVELEVDDSLIGGKKSLEVHVTRDGLLAYDKVVSGITFVKCDFEVTFKKPLPRDLLQIGKSQYTFTLNVTDETSCEFGTFPGTVTYDIDITAGVPPWDDCHSATFSDGTTSKEWVTEPGKSNSIEEPLTLKLSGYDNVPPDPGVCVAEVTATLRRDPSILDKTFVGILLFPSSRCPSCNALDVPHNMRSIYRTSSSSSQEDIVDATRYVEKLGGEPTSVCNPIDVCPRAAQFSYRMASNYLVVATNVDESNPTLASDYARQAKSSAISGLRIACASIYPLNSSMGSEYQECIAPSP